MFFFVFVTLVTYSKYKFFTLMKNLFYIPPIYILLNFHFLNILDKISIFYKTSKLNNKLFLTKNIG